MSTVTIDDQPQMFKSEERDSEDINSTTSVDSYHHISPWALDIGGSLIKLVYFSREDNSLENHVGKSVAVENVELLNGCESYPILNGKLHFAKFETNKINECLDYIETKQLLGSCMILSSAKFYMLFVLC